MEMYGYIYKTTNLLNSKFYIGQRKITADKRAYNSYLGSGLSLNKAIKKYGRDQFKKEIIEYCETREQLSEREIFWITTLQSRDVKIGYNISKGGKGGSSVETLPKDFRERCRQGCAKMTDEQKANKVAKFKETLNNQSEEQKLRRLTQNRLKRKGKSSWSKGLNMRERYSEEEYKKRFCHPRTEEQKKKYANKTITEEHKRKISERNRGHQRNISRRKPVIQMTLEGNFVKEWLSMRDAAIAFGMKTGSNILLSCKDSSRTCKGFKWKLKQD